MKWFASQLHWYDYWVQKNNFPPASPLTNSLLRSLFLTLSLHSLLPLHRTLYANSFLTLFHFFLEYSSWSAHKLPETVVFSVTLLATSLDCCYHLSWYEIDALFWHINLANFQPFYVFLLKIFFLVHKLGQLAMWFGDGVVLIAAASETRC